MFKLQFDPAEIRGLAEDYCKRGEGDDAKAASAGAKIAAGDYHMDNLLAIFVWKTGGRGRSRVLKNTPEEVADALRLAVSAETERAAIAVLRGLRGVDTPVASAIMTAVFPDRYTVIDFRALESLGTETPDRSVSFYLEYLHYCREKARECGVSLRTLDRALWQWSWLRSAGRTLIMRQSR